MSLRKFAQWVPAMAVAALFALSPLAANAGEKVLASGKLKGASNHATSGNVSVVETDDGVVVVLGSNFNFDGAPDPKIGFGKSGSYDRASQLGPLQSNSGEQTYQVPASVDPAGYDEIYVWCEKYAVPLGVAAIK